MEIIINEKGKFEIKDNNKSVELTFEELKHLNEILDAFIPEINILIAKSDEFI